MGSDTIDTSDTEQKPAPPVGHGTPAQEIDIGPELLRRLLEEQRPDLLQWPLEPFASGWDNALFRLGPSLTVRLPRRAVAADLIEHEQAWLPRLAPMLPLPIPTPIFTGRPGSGYPWSWSVVPYLAGEAADLEEPRPEEAKKLADFLLALHRFPEKGAPANPYRDIPLLGKVGVLGSRLERLQREGELPKEVLETWQSAVETEIDIPKTWIHGDLHPKNVLTEKRSLSAIIDWGDMTFGDPATDLACFWLLFESRRARELALERYGVGEKTLRRARGWAVFMGVVFLASGLGDSSDAPDSRNVTIGRRAFARLLDGP